MAMVEVAIDAAPFHNVAIATEVFPTIITLCFDFDVWSLQLPQRLPEQCLSKGAGGQGCEGGAPGVEEVVKRRKEVQGPSPRTPSCDTPTKRLMMAEF